MVKSKLAEANEQIEEGVVSGCKKIEEGVVGSGIEAGGQSGSWKKGREGSMKKSTFVAMILGVIGGILFALGMCMTLIQEWNTFRPGVIMGVIGIVVLLIMVFVWRRMENKAPIRLSGKTIGAALIGIAGTLLFGVGMCLTMVWTEYMVAGIIAGIVGIVVLLCLIPYIKGVK